jgi:glycosyltransferase involved in cell wall biosynthesis
MIKIHLTTAHNVTDTRIFERFFQSDILNYEAVKILSFLNFNKDQNNDFIILHNNLRLIRSFHVLFYLIYSKRIGAKYIFQLHDIDLYWICLFLRLTRSKVIIDIHEDYLKQNKNKNLLVKYLYSGYLYFTARAANFCIFATSGVQKSLGIGGCVVRNFPLPVTIKKDDKLHLADDSHLRIIYQGSLSIHRKSDFMAELIRSADDCVFHYFGTEPKSKNFKDRDNYILFKNAWQGFLTVDDKKVLHRYDLGLCFYDFESHSEVLPVKLLEYMSYGIFTLGGGNIYLESCLSDKSLGEVISLDAPVDVMKARLVKLNQKRSTLRKNKSFLRQIAKKNYSWHLEYNGFLDWSRFHNV